MHRIALYILHLLVQTHILPGFRAEKVGAASMRRIVVIMLVIALMVLGIIANAYVNGLHHRPAPSPALVHQQRTSPTQLPTRPPVAPAPSHPTVQATASHLIQPTPTTPALLPASVRQSIFSQGSSSLKEIALTFDDGPNPLYTPQVLSILQRFNAPGTFFCIGRQVVEYPALARRVEQAGEEIGDHTWSHPDLTRMSGAAISIQINDTATAIQRATGSRPTLFRAPYGAMNNIVLTQAARLGFITVAWSVDTQDWQRRGVESIVRVALINATNGSIILMHDGGGDRSQTVQALPQIITALRARGYVLVTVSRLLTDSLKAGANQYANQTLPAPTTGEVIFTADQALLSTTHRQKRSQH
jgi:peptidoglycan/xylan/chitin deacetylase (PgdA/CDA1 family)